MPTFPASLPEPLLSSYVVEPQSVSIRTDMEAGPARVRRRFTAQVTNADAAWIFDPTQMITFKTFFNTDLDYGTSWFDAVLDFGEGNATHSVRFIGQYTAHPIGLGYWNVGAKLEARS